MLFYLAWKNVISKKSSFVIILFIAFAIMMLVITNSVFDSTENGVQETFINSFTGDVVIRPKSNKPLSLFGDETPVTGKLSNNPTLFPYYDINDYLNENNSIDKVIPQLSGRVVMRVPSGVDRIVYVFGVDAEKYTNAMSSIVIDDGNFWTSGEKGSMISKKYADEFNLKIGDKLDFLVSAGLSSKIRSVPISAIYHYSVENSTMDKIVLANSETVRSLFDISELTDAESIKLSAEKESILDSSSDFDDMFSDFDDLSESVTAEKIEFSKEEIENLKNSYSESSTWNFIICKLKDKNDSKNVIKKMNKYFKEKEWPVEAVDWRRSAGNTAFYLFILRFILNIGIIIILFAGFIVINNTLVVNVLDRIREIGTMRAIGANKRYISVECMAETFIMAIIAGIVGCILGIIGSHIVNVIQITFHNSFLIQLFGGSKLITKVNFLNIFSAFSLSLFIGLIAWIYPVLTALLVRPVQAMQGGR